MQSVDAVWRESVYLGLTTSHRVALANGSDVVCRVVSGSTAQPTLTAGQPVSVNWPIQAARLHLS